jgi:acid phosphatase
MLLGDDLGDFLPRAQVGALRQQRPPDRPVSGMDGALPTWPSRFGVQWFLLPNPSYGSWEVALANCPADRESAACHEANLQARYGRLIPPVPTPPTSPIPPR